MDCELNAWNPSIALVSLEEWREDRPAEDYANYMRLAVDNAISKGVPPNRGLQADGVHLTFARNFFDDPLRMQSAWPWRNLTALQVLDAVRAALESSTP